MSETLNDITKAHVAEKFHDGILQKNTDILSFLNKKRFTQNISSAMI